MAFGLPNSGGGEIVPFLKYNAKAGRMFRVDRVQTASGWEAKEVDITNDFSAVIDLENIMVGWVYYGPNGPQRQMAVYMKDPMPVRPPDKDDKGKLLYKSGFSVRLALSKDCGGGVREFGSSADTVTNAMGALHDQYLAAPEKNEHKLPIISIREVVAEKGSYGTNYRPVFSIDGWVDRPASLAQGNVNGAIHDAQEPPQRATPPATGSTQKNPPAAGPAEARDFG